MTIVATLNQQEITAAVENGVTAIPGEALADMPTGCHTGFGESAT